MSFKNCIQNIYAIKGNFGLSLNSIYKKIGAQNYYFD